MATLPSIVEDRDVLRRPRAWQRLYERVDVGDVLVGKDGLRIGRHVVRGVAQSPLKPSNGKAVWARIGAGPV